jgi:hypothetical protein
MNSASREFILVYKILLHRQKFYPESIREKYGLRCICTSHFRGCQVYVETLLDCGEIQSTVHPLWHTSIYSLSPPKYSPPLPLSVSWLLAAQILIILVTSWDQLHSHWPLSSFTVFPYIFSHYWHLVLNGAPSPRFTYFIIVDAIFRATAFSTYEYCT